MRKLGLLAASLATAMLIVTGVSLARGGGGNDNGVVSARLVGYDETPSISTRGRGTLEATIASASIRFRLRYEGLEGGNATAAHIHFGQRHTAGGVSAFLCGGGGKPACPAGNATVEGTILPADVLGPAGQGIAAGQLDELLAAVRAGAAYVNVHTSTYPAGEIRGQLAKGKGKANGNGSKGKGKDKDRDDD